MTTQSASLRAPMQSSLFGEILDWMLAPLLLIWPMSVALTWLVAQGIATRPYDRELGALALALAQEVTVAYDEQGSRQTLLGPRLSRTAALLLRSDEEDPVYFQILGARGELVAGDPELSVPNDAIPPNGEAHFRDDNLREQPVRVAAVRVALERIGRIDASQLDPHQAFAVVQIAETPSRRSQLATEIIKGVILPQFVILPIAVLLVWFALGRAIRPLRELQQRIRRRQSGDLSPIPEGEVPEEVAPLVAAINDLLQRLDTSMSSQRQFLADAAHQLKTPLAGLRMQAELASREIDRGQGSAASIQHSLQQIALSSERAAHMVNQLLSMARADDHGDAPTLALFDLAELTTDVVREFVPRALAKGIDLGYEPPGVGQAPLVEGLPLLVRELVRNLVDNALLYTPKGGQVTARVSCDSYDRAVTLEVEDNGPGIPAGERELVFRPFYRALGTEVNGSGLGLAIAQQIAQRHGAQLVLSDTNRLPRPLGPGAHFTVRFRPVPAAHSAPLPLSV